MPLCANLQEKKKKNLKTKPWLSKEILASTRYRDKLYRLCLNEQKQSLWENTKNIGTNTHERTGKKDTFSNCYLKEQTKHSQVVKND